MAACFNYPRSPLPRTPVPEGHGSLSVLHPVQDALQLTFRCHFAGSDGSVCKTFDASATLMNDANTLTELISYEREQTEYFAAFLHRACCSEQQNQSRLFF